MPHHKSRPRTYARNRVFSRRGNEKIYETDSWFFLKLICALLLGTFWLKFSMPIQAGSFMINALPVGVVIGLILARFYEPLQINRRIWYTVLIVVGLVSYFFPAGIVL